MRAHMPVQALLRDEIDSSLKRCLEVFDEPHVADHAGRAAKAYENVHIAFRPILPARDAAEDL